MVVMAHWTRYRNLKSGSILFGRGCLGRFGPAVRLTRPPRGPPLWSYSTCHAISCLRMRKRPELNHSLSCFGSHMCVCVCASVCQALENSYRDDIGSGWLGHTAAALASASNNRLSDTNHLLAVLDSWCVARYFCLAHQLCCRLMHDVDITADAAETTSARHPSPTYVPAPPVPH